MADENQPNIATQLLTGKNNQTHDIARWLAMVSFFGGTMLADLCRCLERR